MGTARSRLMGILLLVPISTSAQVLKKQADAVFVTNTTSAKMVNLRVGKTTLPELGAGESAPVNAALDAEVHGRFSMETWHLANTFTPEAAAFHLRTAGHYLDAIVPGPQGDPAKAENLLALSRLEPDALQAWQQQPLLRRILITRAARHGTPEFTARLMGLTTPHQNKRTQVKGYEVLESIAENTRQAIEAHGPVSPIIAALRTHRQWAVDRGFSDPRLLAAFVSTGTDGVSPGDAPPSIGTLISAIERHDYSAAATEAVGFAVQDKSVKIPGRKKAHRMACATLDTAAAQSRRKQLWLATEAYLRLALRLCGDKRTLRDRISSYYRARGNVSMERLDLLGAAHWLKAAYWIGRDTRDKAFLSDTLAELAIIRFRTGDHAQGRIFLADARDLGPLRPRVVKAGEFEPQTDPRARVALAVIIILMAFFAYRRLRRVLFGNLGRGRDTLNHRR